MSRSRAHIQRTYRARRDAGLVCLRAIVDEVDVVEELIAQGYLRERDRDDRRKVERAFQRARIKILPDDDR